MRTSDDREHVRALAAATGARILEGGLDCLDLWGDRIEVVACADIQFTKARQVRRGVGVSLAKSAQEQDDLAKKGMVEGTINIARDSNASRAANFVRLRANDHRPSFPSATPIHTVPRRARWSAGL